MLLHTVNKSPEMSHALDSCLRVVTSGASILLMADGVFAAVCDTHSATKLAQLSGVRCYALCADVDARGLGELMDPGVELVDYAGFVELSARCHAVQSWY
jgi:tRNA 2-thiouridine synthesizing protein B